MTRREGREGRRRRQVWTLLIAGFLVASMVPAVPVAGSDGGDDGSGGTADNDTVLPQPWSHLDVDPARARLLNAVLDAADLHEGSGPDAGMAAAEAALLAKRAEVGSTVPANLSGPLDRQVLNLRTARTLLEDAGGEAGEDGLLRALRDARAGQAWQVEAGGFTVGDAPTEPAHASPSQAAKALVDRFGVERTAEDNATLEELDDLPEPVPAAMTDWIDAYLRLEQATRDAFAAANGSAVPPGDVVDVNRTLEALTGPAGDDPDQPTVAEGLAHEGIDLSTVLPARDAFLAASQELWSALSSAGLVDPASSTSSTSSTSTTSSSSSSSSSGPAIDLAPALAIDLDGLDTLYVDDYGLMLDVGGDDVYDNNAGGNTVLPPPGTAVVSRDPCLIFRVNTTAPAVEVGSHSAAALLDAAGHDTYGNASAPRNCGATGGAAQGVGVLMDGGAGRDTYHANNIGVNGAGFTGLGLIADGGGDDLYSAGRRDVTFDAEFAALMVGSVGTNGGGASRGMGMIVDDAGDDVYRSGIWGNGTLHGRWVQFWAANGAANGGSAGGIGHLRDRGGDDLYWAGAENVTALADNSPGVLGGRGGANGGAFTGASLLLDEGGSDAYWAGVGTYRWTIADPRCGLPGISGLCVGLAGMAGINGGALGGAAATLVDDGDGADTYFAGIGDLDWDGPLLELVAGSNANGGARAAVAFLGDLGGDDDYFSGIERARIHGASIGHIGEASNGGALVLGHGILLDAAGHDRYRAGAPDLEVDHIGNAVLVEGANGGAALADSHGLLADLAGDDAYAAYGLLEKIETNAFASLEGGVNGGAWLGGHGTLVDGDGRDTYFARAFGANGAVFTDRERPCCPPDTGFQGLLFDAGGQEDRYEDHEDGTGLDRAVVAKGNYGTGLQLDADQVPVVNLDQDAGFASIADGLAAARAGDVLIVRPGTYPSVEVGTNASGGALDGLALCGVSRTGYGCDDPAPGETVVSGSGAAPAVVLAADDVTFKGFGVEGASPLLLADGVAAPTVEANAFEMQASVSSATHGVRLVDTTGARVLDNSVRGNMYPGSIAVRVEHSADALVEGNAIVASGTGIYVPGSTDATIRANAILVPPKSQFAGDSLGISLFEGSGHSTVANLVDGAGVGLNVASSTDAASRADRFLAAGTGIELSAPTVQQPAGFSARNASLAGAATALHLAGDPHGTVGLSVDAECNDWGVYHDALIRDRIQDDGTFNEVDHQPWIAPEDDGVGCLPPLRADFTASPSPATRLDAVAFEDTSQVGDKPVVRRTWRFGDGTSETTLGDEGETTTHRYDLPGTYTVVLETEDADGMTSTAARTLVVENLVPVIEPLPDLTVEEGQTVSFTVVASDPEEDPLTLAASDLPSGAAFDADTGAFEWTPTLAQSGTHTLSFHASDPFDTTTETVAVTVADVGTAPDVALLKPTSTVRTGEIVVVVGEEVPLRGEADDPDGTVESAEFLPDGEGSTPIAATQVSDTDWTADPISYATPGDREVLFRAFDDEGLSATASATVRVVENRAPVVRIADAPVRADGPDPVARLDGSDSYDPEGRPVTFLWTLSNGDVAGFEAPVWKVPAVGWTPPGPGVFQATLTVTDHMGLSTQETVDVLVDDAIEVVGARADPASPRTGDPVNVTGTVVDSTGAPVAGAEVVVEVVHDRTGRTRQVRTTTDAAGAFDAGLPHDVVVGSDGINLPGRHDVTVRAAASNQLDLEEDPGPLETAETAFAYWVSW